MLVSVSMIGIDDWFWHLNIFVLAFECICIGIDDLASIIGYICIGIDDLASIIGFV